MYIKKVESFGSTSSLLSLKEKQQVFKINAVAEFNLIELN